MHPAGVPLYDDIHAGSEHDQGERDAVQVRQQLPPALPDDDVIEHAREPGPVLWLRDAVGSLTRKSTAEYSQQEILQNEDSSLGKNFVGMCNQ